ncbi:hypothetical protein AeNC1_016653, partial [Aphanomyces euteiches]
YVTHTREFLLENFPTIYQAPLGWKAFPTATTQTALLAKALCPVRAAQVHQQWFRIVWSALRSHWLVICARTIATIQQQGDQMTMALSNRVINAKQRAHDAPPAGHDARLAKQRIFVAHTASLWHAERTTLLNPEQILATTPPIRRLRRRLPRKPPDPPLIG